MPADFDPQVDYYELLQVHPRADTAVIRSAFRAILKELHAHPDLGGSHERAVLINDAYRVLTDPQLRREYDQARARNSTPAAPSEERKPRATTAGPQMICPSCGRQNRLRPGTQKDKAVCGACRARLFATRAAESQGAEENRLGLSQELHRQLRERGELELRSGKLPRGGRIVCRRCRRVWTAASPGPVPGVCPACGATDWNAFRLFKCRLCGLEFSSPSLRRKPYLLFPNCPGCAQSHWHPGLEAGGLSSLLRFFKG